MQVLQDGGFIDSFQVSWGSRLINPNLRDLGADRQEGAAMDNSSSDADTFQVSSVRITILLIQALSSIFVGTYWLLRCLSARSQLCARQANLEGSGTVFSPRMPAVKSSTC